MGVSCSDAANRSAAAASPCRLAPAHPSDLQQRLAGTTEARPLLQGDPGFALARLGEERAALYAQVADVTVDVDGTSPPDLADEVAQALR